MFIDSKKDSVKKSGTILDYKNVKTNSIIVKIFKYSKKYSYIFGTVGKLLILFCDNDILKIIPKTNTLI